MWGALCTGGLSYLMSFHLVPAAAPAGPETEPYSRLARSGDSLLAVHALAADCACSRIVARRLIARKSLPGVHEAVVWSGRNAPLESGLRKAGFALRDELTAPAGVPQLLVYSAAGERAYAGGYAPRLLATESEARDVEIIGAVRDGRRPRAYPVYGCTMGRGARRARDPLGLKY